MLDRDRLVGDERRLDADRQVRRDLGHGLLDVVPEGQDVAARAHGDGEPDAPARPLTRNIGCGGSAGPRVTLRDVAEADHPAVGDEVDGQDVLLGPERARDADEDLLVARSARRRPG